MARNIAMFGRRELEAHRRFVTGITASVPVYQEADTVESEGHGPEVPGPNAVDVLPGLKAWVFRAVDRINPTPAKEACFHALLEVLFSSAQTGGAG